MIKKRVALSLASPLLTDLVKEQLTQIDDVEIAQNPDCDLTITDSALPPSSIPQLILGKPSAIPAGSATLSLPLRLGALPDQVRYLLSSRTKMAARARDAVDLGGFVLDPDESQLLHKATGQTIRLTDKERLFLLTLYDARDHAMDRKGLLDLVWGYAETAETHTLETHLYRLRQKLEACDGADLIVSGEGLYRLNI